MARTTSAAVEIVLGQNYDSVDSPSLSPFIETATELVTQASSLAAEDGVTLTSTQLELMERWLAAYCYTQMDPLYTSRSTAGASGSFVEQKYLEMAQSLDPSGSLAVVMSGARAGGWWLGKPPSEQTAYEDRD